MWITGGDLPSGGRLMIDCRQNVLIFPAGSEIGFEVHRSLQHNLHFRVFGASGKADHARFLYDVDRYIQREFYVSRPNFLNEFNALLNDWRIDFVFPTHDDVSLYLAKERENLSAKILTSNYETNLVARHKSRTFDLFAGESFCPAVFKAPYREIRFPVFCKPDTGQGAQGTSVAEDAVQLERAVSAQTNLVVTEFLPGEELSVDCFTDRHGRLRFVGPRTRERITVGISYESAVVPLTEDINAIADTINRKLRLRGAWFFQIKRDQFGRWRLLEFAPRQASTMGVYRALGVNFALLSLFDAMDIDIEITRNDIPVRLSRRLQNRYAIGYEWNHVYIDYDDTIVNDGKVNDQAIAFLYQCRNCSKRISLITKHRFNLDQSLKDNCISDRLFDEILLLGETDEKHEHIDPSGAIFIDNYYVDRAKVSRRHGIPVFDVDGIDALIKD
jgi:hypothetical protein